MDAVNTAWLYSFILLIIILMVIAIVALKIKKYNSPRERAMRAEVKVILRWGITNLAMICPHCHTKGRVRTKAVIRDKGIDGGKAAAGMLTGGLSLLLTGLSGEEAVTQAHCDKCGNTWGF